MKQLPGQVHIEELLADIEKRKLMLGDMVLVNGTLDGFIVNGRGREDGGEYTHVDVFVRKYNETREYPVANVKRKFPRKGAQNGRA